MSSPPRAPHVQRLDIQGLRAIAVLAVIADHVLHAPQGGFVGVDVFFVISGFLITGLLLREIDRTGSISFRRFYERRAKRILPAAIVVIVATVAFSYALLGREQGRGVGVDGLFSAFFVGNWRFAADGVDYFQQGTPPSPLQHFWSLGVEEQFYLVWPWVMLLVVVVAVRRRGWSPQRARRVTATTIVVLIAASFAWALIETRLNPTFAYFSTFSRAWELGLGALLAFIPRFSATATMRRILVWTGLAAIAASLVVVSGDSPLWPAPLGLLPVAGTMLVVLAGTGEERGYREPWILRNRVMTYIGDLSYSLYLWHFPVAILLLAVLPQGSWLYIAIALAATFALSALSYRFVEDPARRATWILRRDGRARGLTRAWIPVTASVAAFAVVGAGLSAGIAQLRPASAHVPEAGVVEVEDDPGATAEASPRPVDPDQCWGAGAMAHGDACADVAFDALAPSPDQLEQDTGDAYSCYSTTDLPLDSCHYGSDDPEALRVALVGDSHAAALIPALEPQLEALGWSLDTFTGRGCRLMQIPDGRTDCDLARPETNERLTSGEFDVVLAASTRKSDIEPDGSAAIMREIVDAGTRVVVVDDNPLPDEQSIACTTRIGVTPDSYCATDRDVAFAQPDALASAAREVGGAVVDLAHLYCSDDVCPGIIGGVLVYRDTAGHITATWARTLSPFLARALADAVATA